MQPSNRGNYLPVDTQDHAVSGRASSMPRLTVDPQVKPSKAPPRVPGPSKAYQVTLGLLSTLSESHEPPSFPSAPVLERLPIFGVLHKVGELLFPCLGDTSSGEQPGCRSPGSCGRSMVEQGHARRLQGPPAVGHPCFPPAPGAG